MTIFLALLALSAGCRKETPAPPVPVENEENAASEFSFADLEGLGAVFVFEENGKLGWQSAESGVDGIDGSSFFVRNEYVDFEAE